MATIRNKISKAAQFDPARHSLEVDAIGRKKGARVVVAQSGTTIALRLKSNPNIAEWVSDGLKHLSKA